MTGWVGALWMVVASLAQDAPSPSTQTDAAAPTGSATEATTSWAAIPAEGSSWRMGIPDTPSAGGSRVHVFRDAADCLAAGMDVEEIAACAPTVSPADRWVRFSFALSDDEGALQPLALTPGRMRVQLGAPDELRADVQTRYLQVVGHQPVGYGQLFVLLIDRSASMYVDRPDGGDPAMAMVVQALLDPAALDTFFPNAAGARTGVLLLGFSDVVRAVDGGAWQGAAILTDRKAYASAVDRLLDEPEPAYTHLYDAVRTTLDEVMPSAPVDGFVRLTQGDPALVVLTDGFNNVRAEQTCAENAVPLADLLGVVRARRGAPGARTDVFTVGFGRPFAPDLTDLPERLPERPDANFLCGASADARIDGGLEVQGIDNVSLGLLAATGGGRSLVTEDAGRLGRFLARTGTPVHRWYELRLALPEGEQSRFRLRLPIGLALTGARPGTAELVFFPNPWFDLPSGLDAQGRSASVRALGRAAGTLVVGLALLAAVGAAYVGAYHLRRAVLRRGRRTSEARPAGSGAEETS
ncbi:MAG: hypothetical protein RLZZ383_1062 [Pseudomonadota bacterium]|jgi:hypothetical protein